MQGSPADRPRHPALAPATAIPARFITARMRVLGILARWQASVETRTLHLQAAR